MDASRVSKICRSTEQLAWAKFSYNKRLHCQYHEIEYLPRIIRMDESVYTQGRLRNELYQCHYPRDKPFLRTIENEKCIILINSHRVQSSPGTKRCPRRHTRMAGVCRNVLKIFINTSWL